MFIEREKAVLLAPLLFIRRLSDDRLTDHSTGFGQCISPFLLVLNIVHIQ
jgi:hypothetical protein